MLFLSSKCVGFGLVIKLWCDEDPPSVCNTPLNQCGSAEPTMGRMFTRDVASGGKVFQRFTISFCSHLCVIFGVLQPRVYQVATNVRWNL